jgi:hypothetical protein
VPQLLNRGAALGKQARDIPTPIANRVVERRPDGTMRQVDVSATFDESACDVDVIAACGPMQRRLRPLSRIARVRIGPSGESTRAICGPSGKKPGQSATT